MTIVEQEANHNGGGFLDKFNKAFVEGILCISCIFT